MTEKRRYIILDKKFSDTTRISQYSSWIGRTKREGVCIDNDSPRDHDIVEHQ